MSLEHAFYIIGIIFMSLMILLFIALVTAVLVIKVKIDHIHRMIEQKINTVTSFADTARAIFKKK